MCSSDLLIGVVVLLSALPHCGGHFEHDGGSLFGSGLGAGQGLGERRKGLARLIEPFGVASVE